MPNQQTDITDQSAVTSTKEGPPTNTVRPRTVLAIASAGGHWIQLRRLHPAFTGTRLIYATTRDTYRTEVEEDGAEFRVVPDCNRWQKLKLIKAAIKIFLLLLKDKPDIVISTGAAPGYFAIRLGKLLGMRTIWVDSIANAEELSLSGQRAGLHVHHWITQWKHLEKPEGPSFFGNVLGDEAAATVRPSEPAASPSGDAQPCAHRSPEDEVGSAISHPPSNVPSAATFEESNDDTNTSSAISNTESEHSERKIRIFATVGTDLPFDRLIKTLDDWAPSHPDYEIYAQIGDTSYKPLNIPFCHFIEPPEFKKRFQGSDLIVSHAGMGTILSSLNFQKPLLVMPRIAAKGEHRNEHQLATAKHLQELNKINVAQDEDELIKILESDASLPTKEPISSFASNSLTSKLNEFILTA